MRDLYKRLGVPVSSSEAEIRSVLIRTPHVGLRRDVEAVLLDPTHRRVYDRIHAVISDTGRLRARLGLNHAQNWQGIAASDFSATESTPLSSLYDELSAKVNAISRASKRAEFSERAKALLQVLWVIGTLFGVFWLIILDDGSLSSSHDKTPSSTAALHPTLPQSNQSRSEARKQARATAPPRSIPSQPTLTAPEQPLPESGQIIRFTQQEAIAPFEIKSSTGSHYLVKLADAYSGAEVLTIFVRGGSTVQIDVPLGTYVVKYAAGTRWYGYRHRFGPETTYSKADEVFRFKRNGYRVTGYTITLYTMAHGNLHTYAIRPEDF